MKARKGFLLIVLTGVFFCFWDATSLYAEVHKRLNRLPERTTIIINEYEKLKVREQLMVDYVDATSKLGKLINIKRKIRLPDAIGIGAEKCGTGALRKMISQHPMVRFADPPEAHFFNTFNYRNGLSFYRKLMPEAADYEIIMEKTPAYFSLGQSKLPSMMHDQVPEAKVFLILCDPVNRTLSDFVQEVVLGALPSDATFDGIVQTHLKIISDKLKSSKTDEVTKDAIRSMPYQYHILTTGLYYYHLLRWFGVYAREDIHIIDGERLITDPGAVIEEFQDFLGIPKFLLREDFRMGPLGFFCLAPPAVTETDGRKKVINKPMACSEEKYKGRTRLNNLQYSINETTLEKLRKLYAPHNEKLFKLLGKRFNWQ